MKRSDFNYDLPEQLIAQYPLENRADSRLLCLDRTSGRCTDRQFRELPDLLRPGDLLVFNDTRVIPARLFGEKETGGKVEVLVERITGDKSVIAQIKASKSPRPGNRIRLEDGHELIVEGREQDFFRLVYTGEMPILDLLRASGHIPLPPYIKREDAAPDYERYQTVYARQPGAVAAPTAGLHFSNEILALLKQKKIDAGFVTLHVGAGTFQPVRVENIEEHRMHSEWFSISEGLCRQITGTRSAGGRVIAVGTTVVRCLESAVKDNHPNAMTGETDIFIYPGYEFKLVDGLITNFHLPESTLLMLVSAFAGKDNVQRAYAHAVTEKYRFFSYGDAMLIL